MDPASLFDLCMSSIDRWNKEGGIASEPTIMLVVPRQRYPTGETIALLGRRGPRGHIATIREGGTGYEVVAYFPAVEVIETIAQALGLPSPVVRSRRSESTSRAAQIIDNGA